MLSKVDVLAETSAKKSNKHHAIAPAALGGCGGLDQLLAALAELWEALGELWEGLYIENSRSTSPAAVMLLYYNILDGNLREFVETHIILASGACGPRAPISTSWHHFSWTRKSGK